jgi:hypothetical protein
VNGPVSPRRDTLRDWTRTHSQSVKQAPDPGKLSSGAKMQFWNWDKDRIVTLRRAAIYTGWHPAIWKWARLVVTRKPVKEDDTKPKAYYSISLFSCMGIVVEKVIAKLVSEEAVRKGTISNRWFGSRKGQSSREALGIMVYPAHVA